MIQHNKYSQGFAAANLELQLNEWGYKAHSDWAYKNNFAGAMIDSETGKTLEYRDFVKRQELREMD